MESSEEVFSFLLDKVEKDIEEEKKNEHSGNKSKTDSTSENDRGSAQ